MFVRLNGKEVVVMPFDAATIYALLNGLVETLECGSRRFILRVSLAGFQLLENFE